MQLLRPLEFCQGRSFSTSLQKSKCPLNHHPGGAVYCVKFFLYVWQMSIVAIWRYDWCAQGICGVSKEVMVMAQDVLEVVMRQPVAEHPCIMHRSCPTCKDIQKCLIWHADSLELNTCIPLAIYVAVPENGGCRNRDVGSIDCSNNSREARFRLKFFSQVGQFMFWAIWWRPSSGHTESRKP